jgi:molybdopterin molybdotransferase
MLSFEEALHACLSLPITTRIASVPLVQALHYPLVNTLHAHLPQPLWDYSAMDGYAIRVEDVDENLQQVFEVKEILAAGYTPTQSIHFGECIRIMTGAILPASANTVVIQENVDVLVPGKTIRLTQKPNKGENIRRQGEDVKSEEVLIAQGEVIHAAHIGLCAAQGLSHLTVHQPQRIVLITTGDELVQPGLPLHGAEIYSTHEVMLHALIQEIGAELIQVFHSKDEPEHVKIVFQKAIDLQPDLIISTGGVSVGDFDPVKGVLADLGASLHFWKVKMKPGKPIAVGMIAECPYFALPGNPVSCILGFLLFVRPYLLKSMGYLEDYLHLTKISCILTHDIHKKSQRREFMRALVVSFNEDTHIDLVLNHSQNTATSQENSTRSIYVKALTNQSSANLLSLTHADVLLCLPDFNNHLPRGTLLTGLILPWTTCHL